jgi:TatD DNase family protein
MFTDTHTHLYDEQFQGAETEMMQRAIDAGVNKMYMPNCDGNTIQPMLKLADSWPSYCFPMMGLHPCYVKGNYRDELNVVMQWLSKRKFYAIGEIGLDYYWDLSFKEQQIDTFKQQIELALQCRLPVVIHSRESIEDCITIVKEKQNGSLKGIFHCFSGNSEQAKDIIDAGLHLGIGGVVTYKKSTLPSIIQEIALSHLVLETDAPYLAPAPYRGKRNESAYIPVIAAKIAEIKGISVEEVAAATTHNAEKIFAN